VADTSLAALHAMRRARRHRRLGNLEWFDAAYRVYLVALFGGGTVLWISSSIPDTPLAASTAAGVARHGPAVLGLFAALAVLAGLRGGAQGGPLALEAPDVAHVMLAPIDRRRTLLRPAVQRIRSAGFSAAVSGAVAGQLAGRRLPGSLPAWAAGGALFGLTVALLWAGTALVAHAVRLPLWLATASGLTLLAWQGAAVAGRVPGPVDTAGSLALWGWRQHTVDLVEVVVALALVATGIVRLGRTSLDALARRSSLVAQLRFAVTMQDLRTVVLLRRQLNQERMRSRPWWQLPRHRGRRERLVHAVWRRGWHGLLRLPLTRLVRMAALAATAGVMHGLVMRGTSPALAATALALFVLGLEAMEPLSQEIDQPDRTDALPVERGDLLVRHLLAPAVALVPFAAIAGAAAVLTVGSGGAIAPAAVLAVPTVLAGAAGGVVSIVRDAADPVRADAGPTMMLPEMAGLSMVLKVLVPLLVSGLGVSSVLLVRAAVTDGTDATAAALRGAIGSVLVVVLVATWVRLRDRVKRRFRAFMAEGRAAYTGSLR
jgi:hypothetical protein